MAARYERAFSRGALDALLPGGVLNFLISDLPSGDQHAIDIQLRKDDTLMYYHGTSSLLTVRLNAVEGNIKVRATADKATYSKCLEYGELMKLWTQAEKDKLRKAFLNYLPAAIEASPRMCYQAKLEGYWQNRLCIDWGRRSQPSDKYMVIDRECVIGFYPGTRDRPYDSVFERYAEIRKHLQKSSPKSFGDNIDMLALDEQGNLAVIELKHGSNSTGIYWGPLQVLAYRDAFRMKLDEIAQGIRDLVGQKVELGLLPYAAMLRLSDGKFSSVKAVLAIAEPNCRSKCWRRLDRVVSETIESGLMAEKGEVPIINLMLDDGENVVVQISDEAGGGRA
jgi:hypothetical protein